jgi:hypothetical protein
LLGLTASNFDSNNIGLLDGDMLVLFLGGELGLLIDNMFVVLENEVLGLFFDGDVLVLIHGDLGNKTVRHCHLFHFRTT